MGLLDDAIREHLELKRLHGADASEVARQEHEALGPVRREDIAIPDPGAAPAAPVAEAPAPVEAEEPFGGSVALPPAEPEPTPEPEPVAHEPVPAPEPAEDPGQATVAFSLADLHAAEAAAARPAAEPVAPEPVWEEPAAPPPAPEPQTDAPDVVPADEEPGEHDELEETPDFLQETPEHDRLWFEQKPPRDFDF
jgi:hypothetical protein